MAKNEDRIMTKSFLDKCFLSSIEITPKNNNGTQASHCQLKKNEINAKSVSLSIYLSPNCTTHMDPIRIKMIN